MGHFMQENKRHGAVYVAAARVGKNVSAAGSSVGEKLNNLHRLAIAAIEAVMETGRAYGYEEGFKDGREEGCQNGCDAGYDKG